MIDLGQIRDIETLRNVFFGVCDTYTDVATKIVTAPGYTPEEGKLLVVKFNHEVNTWDYNNEEWMQLYMNVNGSGAMYVETYTYTYTYPDGTERYYELMGGMVQTPVYAVFTYYEFSADDKGYRLVGTSGTLGMLGEIFERMSAMSEYISGKQDTLVSGTNIKTVNGNSLLGSGNLMLGRTVRLANATTSDGHIIVTETETYPARTFGDLFLVKFIDELPTTYSGSLYFYMMNAPVIYPNVTYQGVFLEYGTDIIRRGDTCIFLYNTGGIMWLLYNSRWGADIASKQDALPPVANNAGKVLAVNNAANGLEWVAQSAGTEEVFVCSYDATTGTMDKTTSEISQASNDGKCVLCVSENDIYVLVSNNILTFSRILGEQTTYITYNQSTDKWTKGSVSLQQSLVSGTNIKKVDNTTILGPGNLYTGRFFSAVQEASTSDTFVLSYRTFRVLHIADGITSTSLSVVITQYDAFIIYDNSDNSSDVAVSIVTTNAIFYYKQGSDQFTIPAGKAAKVMFIRISSRVLLEVENNLDVAKNITTE